MPDEADTTPTPPITPTTPEEPAEPDRDRDSTQTAGAADGDDAAAKAPARARRRRRRRRVLLIAVLLVVALLVVGRLLLPGTLEWYVVRTLDQSPMYEGTVGDVDVHLWRGAYSIEEVHISKTTATVPVPLFSAQRVELALEWDALWEGRAVGRVDFHEPVVNFVDGESDSEDQTGFGGPWLDIIQDLFPLRINSARVYNGQIQFHAFGTDPPANVYLSNVEARVENLTNIYDQTEVLIATVEARALAMDSAEFEFMMELDPFSYYPTFRLATRMIGMDLTKATDLNRAYGNFDFEHGWLDLVIELEATEGMLQGYVMPLFRDMKVFSLEEDVGEGNVLQVFWEAIVGVVTEVFENQPRDQFGTRIPLRGDLKNPDVDILATIGNVLRNAFIRAYLPNLRGADGLDLEFDPGIVLSNPTVPESVLGPRPDTLINESENEP